MILIIFTHLHLFGMGWIGVQVFFVLSGFLITRILVRDAERQSSGTFFKNFYMRRVLRIFPAFYLYIALIYVATYAFGELEGIRHQVPFVATYSSNFLMTTQYEALNERGNWMLAHLWSLCVEEHFYLIWPAVVYFAGRQRVARIAVALVLAGPLIRLSIYYIWLGVDAGWMTDNWARAIYVLSPSHIDGFAMGAWMTTWRGRALGNWALALFAVVVVMMVGLGMLVNGPGITAENARHILNLGYPIHMPHGYQFVWGYSLVNIFGALLIWLALYQPFVKRFFAHPWLTFTGKISYGMYVYHLAVITLFVTLAESWGATLRTPESRVVLALLVFPLIYGVAMMSWFYYEKPLLTLKERFK